MNFTAYVRMTVAFGYFRFRKLRRLSGLVCLREAFRMEAEMDFVLELLAKGTSAFPKETHLFAPRHCFDLIPLTNSFKDYLIF